MINRHSDLPLIRQCHIIDIARSGVFCEPRLVSELGVRLMRKIGIQAIIQSQN